MVICGPGVAPAGIHESARGWHPTKTTNMVNQNNLPGKFFILPLFNPIVLQKFIL
jgi:hypothetical protein